MLSQTPVICKYLGKKFGLYPDNEEDEVHADQVNITIHDFIAEGKSILFLVFKFWDNSWSNAINGALKNYFAS